MLRIIIYFRNPHFSLIEVSGDQGGGGDTSSTCEFASKKYVLGARTSNNMYPILSVCEMTEMAILKGMNNLVWRWKDTCSIQNH